MQRTEKRILVVDDDDAIRALLFTVLRRRGFAVDTARNGVDAIDRLDHCCYSVMLLDLMMPRMSGWEVLAKLDARAAAGTAPLVIVLTAGNEPRDLNPAVVAGTVRKPFDIELLLDTVTACMSTTVSQHQISDCPPAESESTAPRARLSREDVN